MLCGTPNGCFAGEVMYSTHPKEVACNATVRLCDERILTGAVYLDDAGTRVQLSTPGQCAPDQAMGGSHNALGDLVALASNEQLRVDSRGTCGFVVHTGEVNHLPVTPIVLRTTSVNFQSGVYSVFPDAIATSTLKDAQVPMLKNFQWLVPSFNGWTMSEALLPYVERAIACALDIQLRPADYNAVPANYELKSHLTFPGAGVQLGGNAINNIPGRAYWYLQSEIDTRAFDLGIDLLVVASQHHFVNGTPTVFSAVYQTQHLPVLVPISASAGHHVALQPGNLAIALQQMFMVCSYTGITLEKILECYNRVVSRARLVPHLALRDQVLCHHTFGHSSSLLDALAADFDLYFQRLQAGNAGGALDEGVARICAQRGLVNAAFGHYVTISPDPMTYSEIYACGTNVVRHILNDVWAHFNANQGIDGAHIAVVNINVVGANDYARTLDLSVPIMLFENTSAQRYSSELSFFFISYIHEHDRKASAISVPAGQLALLCSMRAYMRIVYTVGLCVTLGFNITPHASDNAPSALAQQTSDDMYNPGHSSDALRTTLDTFVYSYAHIRLDFTSMANVFHRFGDRFAQHCYIDTFSPEHMAMVFGVASVFNSPHAPTMRGHALQWLGLPRAGYNIEFTPQVLPMSDMVFRFLLAVGLTPAKNVVTTYDAQFNINVQHGVSVVPVAHAAALAARHLLAWRYHSSYMCDDYVRVGAAVNINMNIAVGTSAPYVWYNLAMYLCRVPVKVQGAALSSPFAPGTCSLAVLTRFIRENAPQQNEDCHLEAKHPPDGGAGVPRADAQ